MDSYVPGHGDPGYDALHYDLALEYDVEGNQLAGTARIDCVARDRTWRSSGSTCTASTSRRSPSTGRPSGTALDGTR